MGVYEYQAMPSLRDIAHEDFFCTCRNRSALEQGKWCDPTGQTAWAVHHVQNHTLLHWVTLLQPARRAAVLGQLSSLRLHWVGPNAAVVAGRGEVKTTENKICWLSWHFLYVCRERGNKNTSMKHIYCTTLPQNIA